MFKQLRFSLRTFLLFITVAAVFCYAWFIRPTRVAKRFVASVQAEDFAAADRLFVDPKNQFLAKSWDTYWGYQSQAELSPMTVRQALLGRRDVHLRFSYFHLDRQTSGEAVITATPLGMNSPTTSQIDAAIIIEREAAALPRELQQQTPSIRVSPPKVNAPQ